MTAKKSQSIVISLSASSSLCFSSGDLRNQFAPVDGMDLFYAMSKSAVKNGVEGYVDDAPKYNGYIYGLRDVLQAEKREREVQLASN